MQTAEWKQPGINPPLLVNVSAHTYSPQGTQEEDMPQHSEECREIHYITLNKTRVCSKANLDVL